VNNIEELDIEHKFWGSYIGTTPVNDVCPQLKVFRLANASVYSLARVIETLSRLHRLEELILFIEWSKHNRDSAELFSAGTPPLPSTLRRFTFHPKDDNVDQQGLYQWLILSELKNLEYLEVHPTRRDFAALAQLLISLRETLKEFYMRPLCDDSLEGEPREGSNASTTSPEEEIKASQLCTSHSAI
jgi:hypothetical protein